MRQERIEAVTFTRGTRVEITVGLRRGQRGTVRSVRTSAAVLGRAVCQVQIDGKPNGDTHTYAGWELRALTAGELAGAGQGKEQT